MEIWSSALIALVLWLAAAWLMNSHFATWRAVLRQESQLGPKEFDYHRRQFRRRMQTSAMLGFVGLGMLVGRLLMVYGAPPLVVVVFWTGVLLLVVWLGLLAVADMVSTRYHFSRLRQNHVVEEARLEDELRRLKRTRGNGRADEPGGGIANGPENPSRSAD
ncbi:MAG: hypothetical protein ABIP48_11490 [Planctomycetota bacterium]